jgi:hypothetical protein
MKITAKGVKGTTGNRCLFFNQIDAVPEMRFPLNIKTSGTASFLMQFPINPMYREPQGTAGNRISNFTRIK